MSRFKELAIVGAAVAFSLGLVGCERSNVGKDQYSFERKEYTQVAPIISVVEHPSLTDLRRSAPAAAQLHSDRELMAYSILNGDRCEVHIVDPAVQYAPEWMGHEFTHCVYGRWHQ